MPDVDVAGSARAAARAKPTGASSTPLQVKHPWRPKVGGFVTYRDAADRVWSARIVTVTSPTVLDLRIGVTPTRQDIVGAVESAPHTAGAAGWWHYA